MIEAAAGEFGTVDILVNNAGIQYQARANWRAHGIPVRKLPPRSEVRLCPSTAVGLRNKAMLILIFINVKPLRCLSMQRSSSEGSVKAVFQL
jgi:NAD(P)-dependent dehydrogenase (short-subunit alcohol dehydrogenase family)